MKSPSARHPLRALCIASLCLFSSPALCQELINHVQEFEDLKARVISWDVPAGNVWETMAQFKRQAREIAGVACNFCSGPQPCSDAEIQKGSCVPQCPGATDRNRIINETGCSLPCDALYSINTNPIVGRMRLFDALDRMLEGTGVTYTMVLRSDEPGVEIVLLDAKRHFDIAAGKMRETLPQLWAQSGIRFFAPVPLLDSTNTLPVQGYLTPTEALNRMIEGTGLHYFAPQKLPLTSLYLEGSDIIIYGTRPVTGMESLTADQTRRIEAPDISRTAFATVQDAVQALPISSLGSDIQEASERSQNPARGVAPNLRGLGTAATLVLVNGRRQAPGGLDGNFIDISTIPAAAVERVDVLPDGASATYGPGAIGGVVNIIMRRDSNGMETRLRTAEVQGGATERLFSQLIAHDWSSGHGLLAYQFTDRDALPYAARGYARNTDKRPLGGTDFSSTASNPGTLMDPATLTPAYALPRLSPGSTLTVEDLIPGANFSNWQAGADLVAARRAHSAYGSLTQNLGDEWTLDADVRFYTRDIELQNLTVERQLVMPRSNPYFFSPFTSPNAVVNYNLSSVLGNPDREATTHTWNGALSVSRALTRRWHFTATASYGEETLDSVDRNLIDDAALQAALSDSNPSTAFNPFGTSYNNPQTLDLIRDFQRQKATSSLREVNARLDGFVSGWGGNPILLSVGAIYDAERLDRSTARRAFTASTASDRISRSFFSEATLPLIPNVALSYGNRVQTFEDSGSATAHRVALNWTPLEALHLRVTWARSYRPPDLLDIDENDRSFVGLTSVLDPKSPTGIAAALVRLGSNTDLKQEIAYTWTAGVDLKPENTGTKLSLTYFSINYRNRIVTPGSLPTTNTLLDESIWQNIITRNPTSELLNELCHSPYLFGSSADCLTSHPVIIDGRNQNLGETEERGIDAAYWQTIDLPEVGSFVARASATYLLHFAEGNGSLVPAARVLAQVANPPRSRWIAALDWYQHGENNAGFSAGISLSSVSAFRDLTQPDGRQTIDASREIDAQIGYRLDEASGWLSNFNLQLNVINLTDVAPPFVDVPVGYDQVNAQPYGRVVTFMLQKKY